MLPALRLGTSAETKNNADDNGKESDEYESCTGKYHMEIIIGIRIVQMMSLMMTMMSLMMKVMR